MVVLPTLPVTAIDGAGELPAFPSGPLQQRLIGIVDLDGPVSRGHFDWLGRDRAGARRDDTPRRRTRLPSWFGPRSAQNMSPGSTWRLSVTMRPSGALRRRGGAGRAASRPPIVWLRSFKQSMMLRKQSCVTFAIFIS